MKTMNVVIIVSIILALFVTGFIFIKKFFPSNQESEEPFQYSFPESRDVPKAKTETAPVYDLPSANLPEPEQ